ncbi:hypothetical protein RUND412_008150 [Rhizina undulata]
MFDLWNPQDHLQSKEFSIEVKAPNIMLHRESRRQMALGSGATLAGWKHSPKDARKDTELLVSQLVKDKVFQFTAGRSREQVLEICRQAKF